MFNWTENEDGWHETEAASATYYRKYFGKRTGMVRQDKNGEVSCAYATKMGPSGLDLENAKQWCADMGRLSDGSIVVAKVDAVVISEQAGEK